MRRNRKRESLRLGTVARSVVTCVCVAATGLAYVWQKNQIYKLGDELKKREAAFAAAEKRNTMLAAQLAHLKSPSFLEARSQQYSLGLVAPRETQMVRLYEPGPEWDARVLPVVAQAQKQASNVPTKVVAQR
jgi:cell division protein FtsB